MTNVQQPDFAPEIHAALLMHDGVLGDPAFTRALSGIGTRKLLDAGDSRTLLFHKNKIAYRQLTQPDGKPYYEAELDGKLKRHYVFVDPDYPDDANAAFDIVCSVAGKNGRIFVLPERIDCGPDAAFVLAVSFECCSGGGMTVLYRDVKQDNTPFLNTSMSGGVVREGIQDMWANMQAKHLDETGVATLKHLMDDMTGKCGSHSHGHAQRLNYGKSSNLSGTPMARFTCR